MAAQQSLQNLISDRYASALYDLCLEKKVVDDVLNDLEIIQSLINKNKNLQLLIKSPLIASSDKLSVLLKLMSSKKLNELSSTFLKLLSKNKRLPYLGSIILQFISINALKRGDVLADITSADKLSDTQKSDIKSQLSNILGDKLSLNFIEDKKIIGGLIIKVGSKMIDTSLANKINKLKVAMKGA